MIWRLEILEGDAPIQRLLRPRIEESIAERLGQIRVPVAPIMPNSGDDGHQTAESLLKRALPVSFADLGSLSFELFATRMSDLLAWLASAAIDPTPHAHVIMNLGRRLIRIEVLEEEKGNRQALPEDNSISNLKRELEESSRRVNCVRTSWQTSQG